MLSRFHDATKNLRAWIVLGVVVVMPALAIPRLNAWLNESLRALARTSGYRERVQELRRGAAEVRQEKITSLAHQLRRLGATELTLEPCAEKGFRFHCEIPVSAANRRDHFQAVHAKPEQAMNLVLDAIVQARAVASRDLESGSHPASDRQRAPGSWR